MQKTLFLLLAFGISISLSAQQLMVEVFSAYNLTAYDHDAFSQENYYPIGARIAGGHEYVQVGLEYRQNITDPEFTITNETTGEDVFRMKFEESYYGALLRVNISSLPVYRAGVVLKGGAGYYQYKQDLLDLDGNQIDETHEFDKKLGYNAGVGLSLPIYGFLHWEVGWQYNIIERDPYEKLNLDAYQANYHSFQLGLSTNFMFGKKSIECRNKRHKKKGKHGREGWYRN